MKLECLVRELAQAEISAKKDPVMQHTWSEPSSPSSFPMKSDDESNKTLSGLKIKRILPYSAEGERKSIKYTSNRKLMVKIPKVDAIQGELGSSEEQNKEYHFSIQGSTPHGEQPRMLLDPFRK